MKKIIGIAAIGIHLLIIGFFIFSAKQKATNRSSPGVVTPEQISEASITQTTDIQASFAIFTNGIFRVFTATMYHNLSQDVYIEGNNPNKVQVKKIGTTWDNFFSTLPFTLTSECLTTGTKETFCTGNRGTLKFYINGKKNNNALSQEIKNGDKLLVTFGTESEDAIKLQLNKIP